MELKDFIALTLSDIAEGVRAAQTKASGNDARINPFVGVDGRSRKIIDVEFHVAVSSTEGTATNGAIGVMAGWIGAKSQGESKKASEAATTIRFVVPMILPTEADKEKHPKAKSPPARRVRSQGW